MIKRNTMLYTVLAVLLLLGLTPLAASANDVPHSTTRDYQGGPTATPEDPVWLAFSVARAALEEEINQDLTYVQAWTFEEFEFVDGIDSCRTLEEGEQPRQLFFGWRFTITTMGGQQYEVRTSFNRELVAVCDEVTQVAAAATETESDPDPDLPAPVAGSAANGAFELGGQVVGLFPETRNAMNTAGMTWVKWQLKVGMDAAPILNESKGAGYKVLFSVIGDKSQITTPAYQDTYASYVAGLAAAGADAIEIWNEMNIEREWPVGQISGANYVPLLAKAYNAIKSANPNTLVITGALAPTGFFGAAGCTDAGCNDDVYMQQMAQAGAGQYADCIGVHYNEGTVSPQQTTGSAQGDNYPTRYFGTMLNRALAPFGGKQACFTELGYLTPDGYGSLPSNFAWAGGTSVAEQAQWLAEAAVASANSGRVRMMIVFNVDFNFYGEDPQAGYAMIRPDGSCPACSSLGAVMK